MTVLHYCARDRGKRHILLLREPLRCLALMHVISERAPPRRRRIDAYKMAKHFMRD